MKTIIIGFDEYPSDGVRVRVHEPSGGVLLDYLGVHDLGICDVQPVVKFVTDGDGSNDQRSYDAETNVGLDLG